jgi:large subunit ribosomal protein L22
MGMVVDQIRGKTVQRAFEILSMSPRKSTSMVVLNVLTNALANAKVDPKDPISIENADVRKDFWVAVALVGPGRTYKRFITRAKGSGSRLLKRTCNLSIGVDLTDACIKRMKKEDEAEAAAAAEQGEGAGHVHGEHCNHEGHGAHEPVHGHVQEHQHEGEK